MLKSFGLSFILGGLLIIAGIALAEVAVLIVEYLDLHGRLGASAVGLTVAIALVLFGVLLWLIAEIKWRWELAKWGN